MEVEGNLQEEKRRIFEQFQLSSARSRKFALENNRRRKALEERQRLWDLREEQTRRNIIEQRKQRINNATQRFQRVHLPVPPPLPPPRRYKQFPRISVPTVEEALIEIQSKVDSCNFQSSNCRQSKSHTSSPNPIQPSQPSPHEALTAVETISQLLPVRRKTGIISYQETEHQLRKQQNYSPQDSHSSDNCDSESLSSKDSLESPKYSAENSLRDLHFSPPFDSQKKRATTGHHFAKQAWADVGEQVGLQEERTQKVSGSLNSLSGASKTPGRKGTIYVHLQPATEVNLIAGSKGKNLISQPARRRMTSEEKGMDLECTPTDEQISQIWHSVRSALTTQHGLRVPEVHKSKLYADRLEDRPGMVQKPLDLLHGLSAISMEERNILLSLERLDQLLQCVRTQTGGHVQISSPLAQDIKSTKHYGQHMS
ncbi:hypothetical protein D4764_12G0002830 [Takifugu flavidus]|uniref:Centrosomal protein of 126 kDa n=1 Tax=Takifugu flavidus TaxID=433684 RepID=A0A5C6PBT9_9TELE|nr:hypothetical protein D4764_12G0002830 [Takifugu flavidus]